MVQKSIEYKLIKLSSTMYGVAVADKGEHASSKEWCAYVYIGHFARGYYEELMDDTGKLFTKVLINVVTKYTKAESC